MRLTIMLVVFGLQLSLGTAAFAQLAGNPGEVADGIVAQDAPPAAVSLAAPGWDSLAAFTLVDWVNGVAFDLDPRIRVTVQPHCNLVGGFVAYWPEADYDCDPEAVFEPEYALEVSVYHSYLATLAAGGFAAESAVLSPEQRLAYVQDRLLAIPAEDVGEQARLNELQAALMPALGRECAGEALVALADGGEAEVPYFLWQEPVMDGLDWHVEYCVYQPDAAAGPQVVTVALRSAQEPGAELIALAAARLRLFAAPQV